jgi:NAD(P)-dependent dehydrogenase (short-subunit alcohol dehydrogenase family)
VLVNNARLMASQRWVSTDGYDEIFAVNHLAPFLLTICCWASWPRRRYVKNQQREPVRLENRILALTCVSSSSGGLLVFVDQAAQDRFSAEIRPCAGLLELVTHS